jgi:hypothetical protein
MVQVLAGVFSAWPESLPTTRDSDSNFRRCERGSVAAFSLGPRGPTPRRQDTPTIYLALGHAALSSLFSAHTQRIEKKPQTDDTLGLSHPEARWPVSLTATAGPARERSRIK